MNVVASIYSRSKDLSKVTAYTDRIPAGSLIGYVILREGLFYFVNDDRTKVYGKGEDVSPSLALSTRATIAARRHFGSDIVVA